MALETERRFTLKSEVKIQDLNVKQIRKITQSYLRGTGDWAVRIRKSESDGIATCTMTMKKSVSKDTSVELEVPITLGKYEEIYAVCSDHLLKTRYVVDENGTWEIDEYHHEGLTHKRVAEIEFDKGSQIQIPEWIDQEITGKREFSNAAIAMEISTKMVDKS